jgi:hypothetical protein
LMRGFNGIYLVRFGFRVWEYWFLSDFCCWKFKYIKKKPGFERKNQLRVRGSTWAKGHRPH